ncbi:MAG: trypsin-like peptidase domain-containing protein [Lachnospiraceae bacterium]|nr:trypsin-like peptidase domain-containing protein [Lachnospiraceae bacterium]
MEEEMEEEKMQNGKNKSFLIKLLKVACIAVVFGLVSGVVFSGVIRSASIDSIKAASAEIIEENNDEDTTGPLDSTSVSTATTVSDVSDIVDNVMPSIVAVSNVSYVDYISFFGQVQRKESEAVGSGIIINQDEEYIYIVTNNHVVEGAETITITFCDDQAVPATVKGTDSSADLAVVAVKCSDINEDTLNNIKVASIGDSTTLKTGESAVVIGNALGYGQSVTTGVISATSREVRFQNDAGNVMTNTLIQTDAAVNPGNSGGALLNSNGQVIGIVSAKFSDTAVEGMGYAIPISTAQTIIDEIINRQLVSDEDASYFGISGVDINETMSSNYDICAGVYVLKVSNGSAADKANIKPDDIVTKFNGKTVTSMEEITEILRYLPAGTKVSVTVAKASDNYKEKELEVTLTNRNK